MPMPTAAEEFLTHKWKLWYKSLDVNHDEVISWKDVEESKEKFTSLHHLLGEKATGVKVDMEGWWLKYILHEKDANLTMIDFINRNMADYELDKDAFIAKMSSCFNDIFDVIDTNKDRSIDEEEFIIAFKAFGHENEKLLRKNFCLLQPENGTVPMKKVVAAWIQFTTSVDPHQKDVVKESFEEGV